MSADLVCARMVVKLHPLAPKGPIDVFRDRYDADVMKSKPLEDVFVFLLSPKICIWNTKTAPKQILY